MGEENVVRYKTQVIVAADFDVVNGTANALYSGIAFHALPISVNLVSNTLLRNASKTSEHTITTINDPLDVSNFVVSYQLIVKHSTYKSCHYFSTFCYSGLCIVAGASIFV